ncbi:MAG: DUF4112 domain-containing protein [Haloarculaceae archaeon]
MADPHSDPDHPGLRRASFAAHLLDDAVTLPVVGGVGLEPLLGLLPFVGDSIAALCSLYVVFEAWLAGVPRRTLGRMLLYVGIDWAVGSVPLVGDLFDVLFRANRRNVRLFRRHVEAGRRDF